MPKPTTEVGQFGFRSGWRYDMHIGLNLIFLVPGETGGMEVYARELIPALVAV